MFRYIKFIIYLLLTFSFSLSSLNKFDNLLNVVEFTLENKIEEIKDLDVNDPIVDNHLFLNENSSFISNQYIPFKLSHITCQSNYQFYIFNKASARAPPIV